MLQVPMIATTTSVRAEKKIDTGKNLSGAEDLVIEWQPLPPGRSLSILLLAVPIVALTVILKLRYIMDWNIILVLLIGGLVSIWRSRKKIIFSRNGIIRPTLEALFCLHALRPWDDLHSVRLSGSGSRSEFLQVRQRTQEYSQNRRSLLGRVIGSDQTNWTKTNTLVVEFHSGGSLSIPIGWIPQHSLEGLFMALSRWADPQALSSQVIAVQRDVLTGQTVHIDDSYTTLWEKSLNERFAVTNYVPLSGGYKVNGGELEVLMHLAQGGMSSLYLAADQSGRRVVLKEMVVPADASAETASKVDEMFRREAQILVKLDHPQIVQVYDHFVEDGRDYLILEFIPGLTLRQYVQMHGPVGEREAILIGQEILGILHYLHTFNPPIIHRDLTPENLVIREPDKKIVLIDFGAAVEFTTQLTGTLIGKQCYIPPEQFRGRALPQSDIYAAGATMHYLLTGEDPESLSASRPGSINSSISSGLDELIGSATMPEVEMRIQSAAEVVEVLNDLAMSCRGVEYSVVDGEHGKDAEKL